MKNQSNAPEIWVSKQFSFDKKKISSSLVKVLVKVSTEITQPLREHLVSIYQKYVKPRGLEYHHLPSRFIAEEYRQELDASLKFFVLKYFIIDHLFSELEQQKLRMAHYPRLSYIGAKDDGTFGYQFNISVSDAIPLLAWKCFNFKMPRRKLYKDLDKQVEQFFDKQITAEKKACLQAENGDWVGFSTTLLDANTNLPLKWTKKRFWMRLQTAYLASTFQAQFLSKQKGDNFETKGFPLDDALEEAVSEHSSFTVDVESVIKGSFASMDGLSQTFKLKTKADVYRKLIEVFSYRNNSSQRKLIIEELFDTLLSKHRFEVPKCLILRKQEDLIISLQSTPADYYVYKAQRDFETQVALLAEKQLKEEILIDEIARDEHIKANFQDVEGYLNLLANEKLREFVYFKPSSRSIEESEHPIHDSLLAHAATREKTLNYVINILSHREI